MHNIMTVNNVSDKSDSLEYRIHSMTEGYYRYCMHGVPYFKDSIHGSYRTYNKEQAETIAAQLKLLCPAAYRIKIVSVMTRKVL